jgi:hypothetical protein
MTAMSRGNSPRRTIGLVVRAGGALLFTCTGALLAFGSYIGMKWQQDPWPGDAGSVLGVAGFALLTGLLIAAPMAAWWFLVPRARWWGIPVGALVTAGVFAAFLSSV